MALPTNVGTGTVRGHFIDSDGNAISGSVKFTPAPTRVMDASATPDPVTILPSPVSVNLSSGAFTKVLLATDDVDLNPINWTYNVSFAFTGSTASPAPFDIAVPQGTTVDLTLVTPATSSGGTPSFGLPIAITDVTDLEDALGDREPANTKLVEADVDNLVLKTMGGTPGVGEIAVVDLDTVPRIIAQNFYASSATGVTNTVTKSDVDVLTIHAADIAVHDVLNYSVAGTILNNTGSGQTVAITVELGSTVVAQTAAPQTIASSTNPYRFEVALEIHLAALNDQRANGTLRLVGAQSLATGGQGTTQATFVPIREAGAVAENLATDKTLKITVTFSAASTSLKMVPSHSKVRRDPGL